MRRNVSPTRNTASAMTMTQATTTTATRDYVSDAFFIALAIKKGAKTWRTITRGKTAAHFAVTKTVDGTAYEVCGWLYGTIANGHDITITGVEAEAYANDEDVTADMSHPLNEAIKFLYRKH